MATLYELLEAASTAPRGSTLWVHANNLGACNLAEINELIDKQDNSEIILDQLCAILVVESQNQQELAEEAELDPTLWELQVYKERHAPWEKWLNGPANIAPIINVSYDSAEYPGNAGNLIETQKCIGIYNVDIVGFGADEDAAVGHVAGDQKAVEEAYRGLRLARNILMAGPYLYLGLRGIVTTRVLETVDSYERELLNQNGINAFGVRMRMRITFSESALQAIPDELELLSIRVRDQDDGQVVLEADYNYTT